MSGLQGRYLPRVSHIVEKDADKVFYSGSYYVPSAPKKVPTNTLQQGEQSSGRRWNIS